VVIVVVVVGGCVLIALGEMLKISRAKKRFVDICSKLPLQILSIDIN